MAHPHGLEKQQKRETPGNTWTIAPDETCGYLSGSVGAPITCDDYETCLWHVQVAFFCAGSKTTTGHVTCFNREDALNTDKCDDVCISDIYNLLCTETSAPYCRTYAYPSDLRDYRCANTPATRVSSASWTYDGQDDPGFSTTVIVLTTTVPPTEPTTTVPPQESTNPPEPKPPVGAIIGGVVGGLAILGFIILGAIYLLRRKRSQTESEAPPPPIQSEPPVAMTNTKPHVDSTAQSPTVGSPRQSAWPGSSVVPPDPTMSLISRSELTAMPPDYSDSVPEMPGDQNNVH
ncbi:hypothetical protein B0T10DRAFT_568971 [Thelonectria olida]|uniref:Uncharacterized protein n=1 Tax=Thelonectria olida TaxID=1576542 RepID=A0A9P9AJL5_9HYPO|nr:hypothetical protein B0T10DRAFT_568971 [Thelonectria olida]